MGVLSAGLGTALVTVASLTASTPIGQVAERPNIVLIMADDLGFSDVGAYGSEIRTPHIRPLHRGDAAVSRS